MSQNKTKLVTKMKTLGVRLIYMIIYFTFNYSIVFGQDRQLQKKYEPNWESLDKRPMPTWFNEAKFGIFVVWGPYSVPAWVDEGYAEWYGWRSMDTTSAVGKFHLKNFGKDFVYEQFAEMFKAELWNPDFWVDLFVKSGAKYVVTTANYHDGFALWPTKFAKTINTEQWNSVVVGPKRDLLGELNEAGRKRGLKMGIYYSLYEWWHPLWLSDRDRYVIEHLHPKFKEVVSIYKPPVIFLDGEWEMNYKKWRAEELAAWLFNESAVADCVVVNDRWGQCRGEHGTYFSSEYGGGEYPPTYPWQEDRGIGQSYGYNRNETIYDYDSADDLIRLLSKVCGNGGNLLLDVGPTADGRIPVIMQERLLQVGDWLRVNGDAIYGSKANPFWPRSFKWGYCTFKPGRIFLHIHDLKQKELNLRGINNEIKGVYFLSDQEKKPLAIAQIPQGIKIELPEVMPDNAVSIIVLETDNEQDVDKTSEQYDDGNINLFCYAMDIHGKKAKVIFNANRRMVHIGNWADPKEWVSCDFYLRQPGTFKVEIIYSSDNNSSGSEFVVEINRQKLYGKTEDTGGWNRYRRKYIGDVSLSQPGKYTISVKPKSKREWKMLGLRSVELKLVNEE